MPNNPDTPFRLDHPLQDYKEHSIRDNFDPLIINWKGKIGTVILYHQFRMLIIWQKRTVQM